VLTSAAALLEGHFEHPDVAAFKDVQDMGNEIVEKHQVAGLDEKERGFNRQIDVERIDGGYRAMLRYEQTLVETGACDTSVQTVDELIRMLRDRGYTQLRSRLNFKGTAYLGTQEPWIEYPDPDRPLNDEQGSPVEQLARRTGWISKVLQLFRP
jgi:hypothetical protein